MARPSSAPVTGMKTRHLEGRPAPYVALMPSPRQLATHKGGLFTPSRPHRTQHRSCSLARPRQRFRDSASLPWPRGLRCHAGATGTPGGLVSALPSPPAGFVLNEQGEVALMAPESKRVLTLHDEAVGGRPLDCVVRRSFLTSHGLEFFLLYPLDVPVIIYRLSAAPESGLVEVEDAEVLDAFPAASYALARRNFHLVLSGYVLTVRGAVCFSQDDVTSIDVDYGLGIGSDLSEGVELASFAHKGRMYLIYTPFDPLVFPAYRDPETGRVAVAEDEELLDDPKVVEAIEEEQEFQRMVNEEEDMAQLAKKPKP